VVDAPRQRTERGTGLLSSVLGVGIAVALVGFASNSLLALWVRTTVDAVAYDAARRVATAPPSAPESLRAEVIADARRTLGRHGRRVEFRFEGGPSSDVVVLHVRSPGVSLLPRVLGDGPVVADLDRRIVMSREPS